MSHSLDGPRLKVRRAEAEIERLWQTEQAFWREARYGVYRAEFNPRTGKHVYRVHLGVEPPAEWGVCIGEIAYNLRSALDGLVHQLASLTTQTPAPETQFPIFLVGRTKRQRRGKRKGLIPHFEGSTRADGRCMIRNLRRLHQVQIERVQPYRDGRGGRDCPLYLLKQMNNIDKHRLLQVVGVKPGALTAGDWGDSIDDAPFIGKRFALLRDQAKVGEAGPDVVVSTNFWPLLAFGAGCKEVEGRAVHRTLTAIARDVADTIERFATEFD